MSDTLENRTLKHYLTFVTDGLEPIEIDEPFGFDAIRFSIKQKDDGYGRDITFSGDDKAEYTFGVKENPLGHQFDKLLEARRTKGYEYICTYTLKDVESNIDYVVGNVDFETADTNLFDYFKAIIVQDTKQAIIKRKEDSSISQFSDVGLDGNDIEPVETSNILIKPVPSIQSSKWVSILSEPRQFIIIEDGLFMNFCQNIIKSEIDDTLTYFSNLESGIFSFPYLKAQEDLTNVQISIYDFFCEITDVQDGSGSLDLIVVVSDDNNVVYQQVILDSIFINEAFNSSYDLTIPLISSGQVLNIGIGKGGDGVIGNIGSMNIDITAKKTAMPSVTKGVRLIDSIKYTSKSICTDLTVNAPRFDVGGEHYNNFIFSGNMLRGRDKFVLSWKSIHNYLQGSPNCDYEINGNENFIGNDEDFYPNNDIGAFLISPNDDSTVIYNERFTNNTFNFKYKYFDQDKDSENTLDVVHSEAEFNIANDQVKTQRILILNL